MEIDREVAFSYATSMGGSRARPCRSSRPIGVPASLKITDSGSCRGPGNPLSKETTLLGPGGSLRGFARFSRVALLEGRLRDPIFSETVAIVSAWPFAMPIL